MSNKQHTECAQHTTSNEHIQPNTSREQHTGHEQHTYVLSMSKCHCCVHKPKENVNGVSNLSDHIHSILHIYVHI